MILESPVELPRSHTKSDVGRIRAFRDDPRIPVWGHAAEEDIEHVWHLSSNLRIHGRDLVRRPARGIFAVAHAPNVSKAPRRVNEVVARQPSPVAGDQQFSAQLPLLLKAKQGHANADFGTHSLSALGQMSVELWTMAGIGVEFEGVMMA